MKKILWEMKWRLQSGEILQSYSLHYLKHFATSDNFILGYNGYYKDLKVKAGDILKLSTDRPTVTNGYYKLTRVQYNKDGADWTPKFFIHFQLLKSTQIAPTTNTGEITNETI